MFFCVEKSYFSGNLPRKSALLFDAGQCKIYVFILEIGNLVLCTVPLGTLYQEMAF